MKKLFILPLTVCIALSCAGQSWTYPSSGTTTFNGSVGIGTSTPPTNALQINGSTFNRLSMIVDAQVQNGFQLKRTGAGATDWEVYTPGYDTDLRFHNPAIGDAFRLKPDGLAMFQVAAIIGPVSSFGSRFAIADGSGGEQIRIQRGTGLVRFTQEQDKDNLTLINGNGTKIFMSWSEDGNVGIGTAEPDQKLTVKGTIHTNEVLIDVNAPIDLVPDYVFEPTYNLLPLSEVETYVKANKHLPEVPSAKQMEEEGLNVKEMNLLLLRKIEELTLHLIEQKKEIAQLKERSVSPDPSGKKVEELTLHLIELKKENTEIKAVLKEIQTRD